MEIKIYEIVETETLRHRETAKSLLQIINEKPVTESIVLDFAGITFTSRSFMHELLSGLQDRDVTYSNTTEDVGFMIKMAFKKPVLRIKTVGEVKELVAS